MGVNAREQEGAAITQTTEQPREEDDEKSDGALPRSLSRLAAHSWGGALKRTVSEFREANLTDIAAALTYYGVLAIFPAIIALVSILGLVGHSATQPLIEHLGKVAPGPAK